MHSMKLSLYCVVLWPAAFVNAQHCRTAGQIFFADVVDQTITLRTDSDDLVNFNYDRATKFFVAHPELRDAYRKEVTPEQLENGDRLCVGTSEPVVVTVTPRTEINAEQKKELAQWQADSLYGVVSGLDRTAGLMTLEVSAGDQKKTYSIDVSPNAVYWFFPRSSSGLRDAVSSSLDRIAVGDTLYVRGTKTGASQKLVATLIISGGFRSFAVTIQPAGPLDDLLQVRLVPSGDRRTVHIAFGEFYAVGRADRSAGGNGRRLHRISVADLQPGDTVLILGIDKGDGSLDACALVAGFSPFGVLPPDPSQQMRWIFDNVAPGDSYLIPAAGPLPRKP
jgi:hypothetical protein